MLALLFDTNFWLLIITIALIGLLIWACIKFPSVRVLCFTILCLVFVAFTTYCGIQLNTYYSASGGIYGQISTILRPEVDIEELEFKFSNMELRQVLDTDTYSLKLYSDEVVKFDEEKTYNLFVNNNPCDNQEVTTEYVLADYAYVFYGDNREVVCVDTLELSFVFDEKQSFLLVQTNGGSTAVKYWNYYFNRNDFTVTLREVVEESMSTDFIISTGDTSNIACVNYYVGNTIYSTDYYNVGAKINPPDLIGVIGWTLNNETIDSNFVVNSNIDLYAAFDYSNLDCNYQTSMTFYWCNDNSEIGILCVDDQNNYYFYNDGYCWDTFTYNKYIFSSEDYAEVTKVVIASSNENVKGFLCFDFETKTFTKVYNEGYGWSCDHSSKTVLLKCINDDTIYLEFNFADLSYAKYEDSPVVGV